MVVFKEDYDLTRRTPTPPAQRVYRLQAAQRQQRRERQLAHVRGKFEMKRRESSPTTGNATNAASAANNYSGSGSHAVTRWGGTQTGRSLDHPSAITTSQHHFNIPQLRPNSGADGNAGFRRSTPPPGQQDKPFSDSPPDLGLAFNPGMPMQGIATMKPPPVTNDSFSGFFGGGSNATITRKDSTSSGAAAAFMPKPPVATADAMRDAITGGGRQRQVPGTDEIFLEEIPRVRCGRASDAHDAADDDHFNKNSNGPLHRDDPSHPRHHRVLSPPCGFDTLDDPGSLFFGEKRISGEDHFERFRFDVGADEIRDAAVVREFKRLVIDGHHNNNNNNNNNSRNNSSPSGGATTNLMLAQAQGRGAVTARAMSANSKHPRRPATGGSSNNTNNNVHGSVGRHQTQQQGALGSCRVSADPKDHQGVIEGLLGTTEKLTAPSAIERESIRMLRVASASDKSRHSQLRHQHEKRQSSGDVLSARLTSRVSGVKRGNSPTSSHDIKQQQQQHDHQQQQSNSPTSGRSAAQSIPRPPPGFYKQVAGRAQNSARVFAAQAQRLALAMEQSTHDDPDSLQQRPPFRLRGADNGGDAAGGVFNSVASSVPHRSPRAVYRTVTNNEYAEAEADAEQRRSKVEREQRRRIAHDKALEEDVKDDIRFFEWRRSAQQHARHMAKVQVAREKELAVFERRQCERFRDALARFEPGALQRTERAIQHRIAHELVSKYGPATFLGGSAVGADGKNSPQTDRDIAIPVSFQACAREAALVAAETARAEKAAEENRRKQLVLQAMQPAPPAAVVSASAARLLLRRRSSSVPSEAQASGATASSGLEPRKVGMLSIANYVEKSSIASSGYGARQRSVLPAGKATVLTDENNKFISSAKCVRDEIDAHEQRCPGMHHHQFSPPQLMRRG